MAAQQKALVLTSRSLQGDDARNRCLRPLGLRTDAERAAPQEAEPARALLAPLGRFQTDAPRVTPSRPRVANTSTLRAEAPILPMSS